MNTAIVALIATVVIVAILTIAIIVLRRGDRQITTGETSRSPREPAGKPPDIEPREPTTGPQDPSAESVELLQGTSGPLALPETETEAEVAPGEARPESAIEPQGEIEPALAAPAELAIAHEPPRIRDRLGKVRGLFSGYLGSVASRPSIDDQTWEDLEEALIRADVGVSTTSGILEHLRGRVKAEKIKDPILLTSVLKEELKSVMEGKDRGLAFVQGKTNLWLFVGVNGVGKTTTIGKVATREITGGRNVIMAAGDTFRAAAGEQLEQWAKRSGADIVRGAEGGDPGAVVFDALSRAKSRNCDLVLADTAGRLHTKVNLMEELKKIRRVADRSEVEVSEVLLVLDATTGQNGLVQAREFTTAVGVTGVVLTKLDGTAKGGIALAIEKDLGLPIKLVGLGESAADLIDFDPEAFVEAVVGED
ncbi:MAG TPA: signal recognition particle-docking protein FtsY [Acidimicrobiales bacterium]|nr:signal recognition particle-docking protein FtsY [Acidimicrobiales bacterium]